MKSAAQFFRDPGNSSRFPVIAAALLLLQHLCIFWSHYLGTATFFKDFTRSYYPMTAFWTAMLQQQMFPEWMPFQNLGFPFVLSMQSGIFYPPLWLFALTHHLPYSLQMANAFQAAHVLFGAVGCLLYVRALGLANGAALFAAVAFQFFGGFYANAEHPDIIRALAWMPWLFWSFHLLPGQLELAWRNRLAPLVLCLFFTAVYPGNLIALVLCLLLFTMLVWASHGVRDAAWMRLHGQLAGLGILGATLAAVYLVPTAELLPQLVRAQGYAGHHYGWLFAYWDSLLLPVHVEPSVYVAPSMVSVFVTVPVFCLLFLARRPVLRRQWPWWVITVFALCMAGGSSSLLYGKLMDWFPFLGLSRYPSSDYRGIFGFGLILFATVILDDILKREGERRLAMGAFICVGLLLSCALVTVAGQQLAALPQTGLQTFVSNYPHLASAIYGLLKLLLDSMMPVATAEWLLAAGLATIVFVVLHRLSQRPVIWLAFLIALELVSGAHVLYKTRDHWQQVTGVDTVYPGLRTSEVLPIAQLAQHPLANKPACAALDFFENSWRGYLQGNLPGNAMCVTKDADTWPLLRVNADPVLTDYLHQAWQSRRVAANALAQCDPVQQIQSGQPEPAVQQVSYGLQEIHYRVNATTDFCFIENDMQFPGWSGVVAGRSERVEPQAYCSALRSWCLPSGEYEFTATYRTPGLRVGAAISFLCLLLYGVLLWRWLRR